MIRTQQLPPKPVLCTDMDEYRVMQKLMLKVQDEAAAIRRLQDGRNPDDFAERRLSRRRGVYSRFQKSDRDCRAIPP